MPTQVQSRRGTTAQHSTFTGAAGELTVDTDKKTVVVHDGSTAGGAPLLRENGSQNAVTTGTSTAASFIPTSSTAPTNGVYLSAANSVAISTNGSGRLFVDSSGQVGLGTSSPVSTLTANSGASNNTRIYLQSNAGSGSTNAGFMLGFVGTDSYCYSYANGNLLFGTNNAERMRIDSSGRVGIGTTSPDTLLNTEGGSVRVSGTRTAGSFLDIVPNNTGSNGVNFSVSYYGSGSYGPLNFLTGGAERARIDSSGRLLVGTSTSTSVGGAAALSQIVTGANIGLSILRHADVPIFAFGRTGGSPTTVVNNGDELGRISFAGADGSDIDSVGASITAVVDGTPGNNDLPSRLVFSTTADGASSPTERMRLSADSGMRLASSTFILCPYAYNTTSASAANLIVGSDGNFFRSTSSARYKTDIETLQDQYADVILDCRPVWYRSTCEKDNPTWGYWGFIAEEVAEVDPRLVFWKTHETIEDEEGNQTSVELDEPVAEGVQYDRFVPHLLNLIKRQKEQIEAMEARLSALEAA